MRRASLLLASSLLLLGCPGNTTVNPDGGVDAGEDVHVDAPVDAPADAPPDVPPPPPPDGSIKDPCSLPGTVQFTKNGVITVPGGAPTAPSLAFLHLPEGFCAHYYGTVGNARQLRFAPGGELFVASPTQLTTGGGAGGQNAIVILPDDNLDGLADAPITFLSGMTATQGIAFAPGYFYYQDGTIVQGQPAGTKIKRMPYKPGDRAPSTSELVADITYYVSGLHWPKPIDIADDGTIYVGNGGDQGEACDTSHPFHGGILKIGGNNPMGGTQVAKGFRNPIALRCAKGHNQCFALELAKDYTATANGREKMVPIRQGDDWGFPCCATKNLPYADIAATDCSKVTSEDVGFLIGDTPFGLAFAPSNWPGSWANRAIVANHGAAGSWSGARIVGIAMDPNTGLPLPGNNNNGQNMGSMVDFATGWDDGTLQHGRPAALDVSPDGRLFVANDTNGVIFWIAPMDMTAP
jgi:glucose/arabinose dehydrogenase